MQQNIHLTTVMSYQLTIVILNLCGLKLGIYNIERVHREKKHYVLLGDLDIELLKYEFHQITNGSLNSLGIFIFQPHIFSQLGLLILCYFD